MFDQIRIRFRAFLGVIVAGVGLWTLTEARATDASPELDGVQQACSTCSNPSGNLGDYTCIAGKKYRCRNNAGDVCAWEDCGQSCP